MQNTLHTNKQSTTCCLKPPAYYNLQMFIADKKVFEVGEGTQQSKITDT